MKFAAQALIDGEKILLELERVINKKDGEYMIRFVVKLNDPYYGHDNYSIT